MELFIILGIIYFMVNLWPTFEKLGKAIKDLSQDN